MQPDGGADQSAQPAGLGHRRLARSAALVATLTATSALFGLGRDVVIAAVYGAGAELDAYLVALGLMNLVLGLLGGALVKASVPVLSRQATRPNAADSTTHTVAALMSALLVVLGCASLAGFVLAAPVSGLLAPGFGAAQVELTANLTRIVLLAVIAVAATNLLAGAAQSRGRFFWSSAAGIPFNVVMLVAAGVFGPRYGIAALAVGFVLGSLARLVCQLVPLAHLGLRVRLSVDRQDPGAREVARLVPALLVGSAVSNVNTLVDRAVGSTVGEGVISALSYAWRTVGLGETLVVASLITVLYPAFGAKANDRGALDALLQRAWIAITAVLAPLVAVMVACAIPITSLVFQRGSFTAADVAATATALMWYAPALLALAWRELVVRVSLAVGDARSPVLVALAAMAINIVGDLTLGLRFGVAGLAVSTTLSLLAAAALNAALLARRHGVASAARAWRASWRCLLATMVCGATACGVVQLWDAPVDAASSVLVLAAASVAAGIGYVGVLAALRAPELALLRHTLDSLRHRATQLGE